jgi:hypothetical protein
MNQYHGAHLPVVNSTDIISLLGNVSSDTWIGAFRLGSSMQWIDNKFFTPSSLYFSSSPSNDGKIECIVYQSGGVFAYSGKQCSNANSFFCHLESRFCASHQCNSGYMLDISIYPYNSCLECSLGRYQNSANQAFCQACPVGSFQNLTAQTKCTSCLAGKYTANLGMSGCYDCPSGFFANASGLTACFPCSPGSYQDSTGKSVCLACGPGFFTNKLTNFSSCVGCLQGKFTSKNRTSQCTPCPIGSYADKQGLSLCKACVGGTTIIEGAVSPTDCAYCSEGYFGDPPNNKDCQQCPNIDGVSCPSGSKIPFVSPGFYRMEADPAVVVRCDPTQACQETGQGLKTVCGSGYSGSRCGDCAVNFYHYETNCKACPPEEIKWITLLCGLAVVLFIIYRSIRRGGKFPQDARVIVQGIQVLALYPNISIKWPSFFLTFLQISSFSVFISFSFQNSLTRKAELEHSIVLP